VIRSGVAGNLGRVRLEGEALEALRAACFERDRQRCKECGRRVYDDVPDWQPNKANMAHREGRGAGGSDTLANVETKCHECHFRWEHHAKALPRKRKL
jgi:5-methylcytosine-specific restriction endonuclease McrA